MTTLKSERARSTKGRLGLAEILVLLAGGGQPPIKITAYDGSSVGPDDAALGVDLLNPRATT
ncbi:SAM-dependent methyltransferase, partial [Mycolicibacter sinensis]